MVRKIYLLGGDKGKREYFDLDSGICKTLNKKYLFVIDYAKDTPEKLDWLKKAYGDYFNDVGYSQVEFSSDFNDEDVRARIKSSEIILIAGGNTEALLSRLIDKGLNQDLENFEGIIVGNSAGAYACCKKYVKIRNEYVDIIDSLGLIDFCIKAHYEGKFDSQLGAYSNGEIIYGIPEGSVIIAEAGRLEFSGDIYLFEKGKRTKVN